MVYNKYEKLLSKTLNGRRIVFFVSYFGCLIDGKIDGPEYDGISNFLNSLSSFGDVYVTTDLDRNLIQESVDNRGWHALVKKVCSSPKNSVEETLWITDLYDSLHLSKPVYVAIGNDPKEKISYEILGISFINVDFKNDGFCRLEFEQEAINCDEVFNDIVKAINMY